MGRVRHPCPVVLVVWLVFVGGLGGIATIGAALRRVVGVSGVYGRKTPRVVAWKGQRRGAFRWRCGRRARAATCGVNVRSGGSCCHLTREPVNFSVYGG